MNNNIKEKNKIKDFLQKHKRVICVTGCTIITLCCATLLLEHKKTNYICVSNNINPMTEKTIAPSTEMLVENMNSVKVVDVREHIRHLPQGYYPSIKKIEEAAKQGIQLTDNQTIVSAHSRCYAA